MNIKFDDSLTDLSFGITTKKEDPDKLVPVYCPWTQVITGYAPTVGPKTKPGDFEDDS